MKGNIDAEDLIAARKKFGEQVRRIREEKGLTQEDVAQLTGMLRATVGKIEQGKWNFGIDTITLFAKHLNFSTKIVLDKKAKG